jgi:hypothetical protein
MTTSEEKKKQENSVIAIKNAHNMLVVFRKLVEGYSAELNTYTPREIELTYKQLWLNCLDEEPPWEY